MAEGKEHGKTANQAVADLLAAIPRAAGAPQGDAPVADDLTEAELDDLLTYASGHHASIDDVVAIHGSDEEFNAVTEQIATTLPNNYLGAVLPAARDAEAAKAVAAARVPATSDAALHVLFSGTAPASAVSALAALKQPVAIEENIPITADDLQNLPTAAGDELARRHIPCVIYFNLDTRNWVVSCERDSTTAAEVADVTSYLADTAPVAIDVDADPTTRADNAIRGGAYLDGGGGNCTSGFVMERADGVKRLATAGHCAVDNSTYTYWNHDSDGGSSTTVGRQNYAYGPDDWGTYGFGSFYPEPVFYYDFYSAKRTVTGQRNTPLDMYSDDCHFGRTTGRSCGDFLTSGAQATYEDGVHVTNLWLTEHIGVRKGDSGGPVFLGSIAHGFCSGFSGSDPDDRQMFYEPVSRMLPTTVYLG